MADSTYHRMSVQHINRRAQSNSPEPVDLVHQQQSQIAGAHSQWRAEAALEAHLRQQALAEIQDLERQRLGLAHQQQ